MDCSHHNDIPAMLHQINTIIRPISRYIVHLLFFLSCLVSCSWRGHLLMSTIRDPESMDEFVHIQVENISLFRQTRYFTMGCHSWTISICRQTPEKSYKSATEYHWILQSNKLNRLWLNTYYKMFSRVYSVLVFIFLFAGLAAATTTTVTVTTVGAPKICHRILLMSNNAVPTRTNSHYPR